MSPDPERRKALGRLRRVRDRIDREFDRPLDVAELARAEHVSAGHLSRQFTAAYGESLYSYLMTRRIERAMALLRHSEMSVTDVCMTVGFSSLGTFSTRFSELVGMAPSAYRAAVASSRAAGTLGTSGDGVPACVVRRIDRPVRNEEARPWSAP